MRRERSRFASCASCLLAALFLPGAAGAQSADTGAGGSRQGWSIVPRIAASETYTDNVSLARSGETSEFITEITPGVRVQASTARLQGSVDYGLTEYFYARDSSPRRSAQSMNGTAQLEALDDFAFVDFNANISQQKVSAFGARSSGGFSLNANSTETRTTSVSPFIRGQLGNLANYQLRYLTTAQSTESGTANDTFTDQWSGALSGTSSSQKISWALSGSSQRVRYGDRATTNSDAATARVNYQAGLEYRFWVSAGRERNDFNGLGEVAYSNRAFGLDWTPGPRTSVSASRERRFFGDSDNLSITHRMRQALFKLSHGKSVSVIPNQVGAVGLGTNYDYWYAFFESAFPDPVAREAFTRFYLAINGLDPNGPVVGLFLAQRVSVQERSELAVILTGVRNTLTLTGSRSKSRALIDAVGLGDDFDTGSEILQNSLAASWAIQLNPASSVSAGLLRSESTGNGPAEPKSVSRTFNAAYQTRLGAWTGLKFSWSRIQSEGASSTYTANTAIASISHTF
jgi:uncharacterized protein (PEP-CTERM system associated)